jgi:hypothetical protein
VRRPKNLIYLLPLSHSHIVQSSSEATLLAGQTDPLSSGSDQVMGLGNREGTAE